MEVYHGIHIQHAGNGGEITIPSTLYRPDGYSDGCVWEFDGDYYHGNPKRYVSDKVFPHSKTGVTFGDMFARTIKKREDLATRGYKVISIWESDWTRAKQAVVSLQRVFRSTRSK
jgi:G:T-mismatch repair DNA endonuclease (very short patch repair protein)